MHRQTAGCGGGSRAPGQQQRDQKAATLDRSVSACLSVFSLSSVSGPLPMIASTTSCLIGPPWTLGLAPQHPALAGPHHQLIFLQALSKPGTLLPSTVGSPKAAGNWEPPTLCLSAHFSVLSHGLPFADVPLWPVPLPLHLNSFQCLNQLLLICLKIPN